MDETPITIHDYDPAWRESFEEERERIDPVVGAHATRIEHVGSTSVRGLGAKPIVDLTAVIDDLAGLWGGLDQLKVWYGYHVSSVPGDWLMLQRTDEDGQAYNLHLIPEDSDRWRDDLLFRELLRSDPETREKYEEGLW